MKELQIVFPAGLTDEETQLKAAQDRLKQLRRLLNNRGAAPIGSREDRESQNEKNQTLAKRRHELALKTDELKKKIAAGEIKLKKADETKTSFKRANVRQRSSGSTSGELGELTSSSGMMSPPMASPPLTPWSDERRSEFTPLTKGRILFIRGYDLQTDVLEAAFRKYGEIESTSVEDRQKVAYMTFKSDEKLEEAVKAMDGNMVSGVTLRVSFARRQGTTSFKNPPHFPYRPPETTPKSAEKRTRNSDVDRPPVKRAEPKTAPAPAASASVPAVPKIRFKPLPTPKAGNESPEDGEINEDAKMETDDADEAGGRQMVSYDDPFS